jgi:hypothetical protein
MSTIEAGFLSLLVMAVVAIVALFRFNKKFRLRIKWLGNLFALDGSNDPPKTPRKLGSTADRKSIETSAALPEPSHLPAWFSWHRLKISVLLALILMLIVMPLWWWNRHSEAWKVVLSDHIAESWALWKQDPHKPVHVAQSGATLHGLTQLLDDYANMQSRDPHRAIEVWVVDHYWQYWTTDTFNDYVRANRKFVDSGGKIHRLFILTQDDLRNPQVAAVLRNQCEKIGADVWRSDAVAIRNKAEYQITAKAFQQMPYTETGFQSFDVLQLEDLTYYSSDFSPDYRVVGASTWFYGQTLDLKPLFNKSIAQRVDCSSWRTSQVAETTQRQ